MASSNASPMVPKGHVVSQVEAQGQDASGRWVPGVNVTGIIDGSGVTFTVFVPASNYTAETVTQALEARAAQVAAVHGITFGG